MFFCFAHVFFLSAGRLATMRPVLLLLLASSVLGQGLISALKRQDSLGLLYTYVTQNANLTNLLNTANNFTFLAPSDDAIKQWLAGKGSAVPSAEEIEATITYHLLQGGWPTVLFSTTPQFVASSLRDARYTNVTTGQAVELVLAGNGPQFISGDRDVSTLKLGVSPTSINKWRLQILTLCRMLSLSAVSFTLSTVCSLFRKT